MIGGDNSMSSLIAEAERLGKEQEKIDAINKRRRSQGLQQIPDLQDLKTLQDRHRVATVDAASGKTIDSSQALKLFEKRKEQLELNGDTNITGQSIEEMIKQSIATLDAPTPTVADQELPQEAIDAQDDESKKAVTAAEAARRVQDLKNGRIDHAGNWSQDGQKLEGGDDTVLVNKDDVARAWGNDVQNAQNDQTAQNETKEQEEQFQLTTEKPNTQGPQEPKDVKVSKRARKCSSGCVSTEQFEVFKNDLYTRLGVSFDGIERSLSDLQGRVNEIVTATTPVEAIKADQNIANSNTAFNELLSQKTQVIFNVNGTKLTFDAVCVFSAPPCITVVSKIDSAKITPKPGAQLQLSYEMNGQKYTDDPVTFLGTRFDLPMFGLSFVGFIRDKEADLIDAAAGITAE